MRSGIPAAVEEPSEIFCDVANGLARFDLRVGVTTYRGAGLQGQGGAIRTALKHDQSLRQRAEAELRGRANEGVSALILVTSTVRMDRFVFAPPRDVEVLGAWEPGTYPGAGDA